jgi:hypothetical protein
MIPLKMKHPTIRLLFDKKKSATKEKKGLIQIEIMYNRTRKYISTGIKVYAGQWKDTKMVNARHDADELNTILNNQLSTVRKYIISLQEKEEPFSFEKLESFLTSKDEKKESFLDFMQDRIQVRTIRESTRKQHFVVYNKLIAFGKITTFSDLTTPLIKEFDDFIRGESDKCQNTINGIHKRLKPYIHEAMELGYIIKNPYDAFKVQAGKARDRKYLTLGELEHIENCVLHGAISNVRDIFVFCCFTNLLQ